VAGPLIRRDVWGLEEEGGTWHPIVQAYALAVGAMQERDPEDPTGWEYQAAVHGVRGGRPPDDFRNQCQHNTWFFLPWHRMYLSWFERIVRAAVQAHPDVPDDVKEAWALPYWNYDRGGDTAQLPTAFREEQLSDGADNALFTPARDPDINDGEPLSDGSISAQLAMEEEDFAHEAIPGLAPGFGGPITGWHHFGEGRTPTGALEATPHNDIHGEVGGNGGLMSVVATAPLDPIFWLHHANVDRLWGEWLAQVGRENPTDTAWTGLVFHFHDEDGAPVESTAGEVLNTEDLGYAYDEIPTPALLSEPGPRRRAMPGRPVPDHPPELVGATEDKVELSGSDASVAFPVGEASGPALLADDGRPSRVYLNVEDVEGEQNPGASYAVYLNLPDDDDPDTDPEAYHVGNVSFFGIELAQDVESDHTGGRGLRFAFDITTLVERLSERGKWDPQQVRVTFSPLRAPREGAAAPTVRIGRVGIYYQ
jgi:tyrosinase